MADAAGFGEAAFIIIVNIVTNFYQTEIILLLCMVRTGVRQNFDGDVVHRAEQAGRKYNFWQV